MDKELAVESQFVSYHATTNQIAVTVYPIYLESQSSPDENNFLWAYHVRIDNKSGKSIQLLNRYWKIIDALGRIQEVRGAGVVGEQPVIEPEESFEYTSGASLSTPSGIMEGNYEMGKEDGARILVDIPPFSLDSPYQSISLN